MMLAEIRIVFFVLVCFLGSLLACSNLQALSDGIYDAVTYTVGDYAILIIQLKDSANDDLCAFTAAVNVTGTTQFVNITDLGGGKAQVLMYSTVADTFSLSVKLDADGAPLAFTEISGSPFTVTYKPGPFNFIQTVQNSINGIGYSGPTKAGELSSFIMQPLDSFGNVANFTFASLSATVISSNGNHIGVFLNQDINGTTYGSYSNNISGDSVLVFSYEGESWNKTITNNPGTPVAANSVLNPNSPYFTNLPGTIYNWTLRLYDAFNNFIEIDSGGVTMDVDSPGPSFSYDIQYGSNGVYLATLQGSSYGDYFVNISITEGGVPITVPPGIITITVADPPVVVTPTSGPNITVTTSTDATVLYGDSLPYAVCASNTGDATAKTYVQDFVIPSYDEKAIAQIGSATLASGLNIAEIYETKFSGSGTHPVYKTDVCGEPGNVLVTAVINAQISPGDSECANFQLNLDQIPEIIGTTQKIYSRGGFLSACCGFSGSTTYLSHSIGISENNSPNVTDWSAKTFEVVPYNLLTSVSRDSELIGCGGNEYHFTMDIGDTYQILGLMVTIDFGKTQVTNSTGIDFNGNPPSSITNATFTGENRMILYWDNVTGTANTKDLLVIIPFVIPENDQFNVSLLGNSLSRQLNITTFATSTDNVVDEPAIASLFNIKALDLDTKFTIDKDISPSSYSPGDIVRYQLEFSTSQYFRLGNTSFVVDLDDGLLIPTNYSAYLQYGSYNYTFVLGAKWTADYSQKGYNPSPSTNGKIRMNFDAFAGLLTMGLPCPAVGKCSKLMLIFYVEVSQYYTDKYLSGSPRAVIQGDRFLVNSTVNGFLWDGDCTPTGVGKGTGSMKAFTVSSGVLELSLGGVNGNPCVGCSVFDPGALLNFTINYDLPLSRFEDLCFDITGSAILGSQFADPTTNTSDALNSISIGAGDTFSALSGVVPNITQSDGVISVCYGDYYSQTSVPSKIQLTFTMRVSTENYPDLNNFGLTVESTEKNNSIVDQFQFKVRQPRFKTKKTIIGVNNPSAQLSNPAIKNYFTTSASFIPPVTSLPESDITGVDGGDCITMAYILENDGSGIAYDIAVKLVFSDCFYLCSSFFNITDGAGNLVNYTGDFYNGGVIIPEFPVVDPTVNGSKIMILIYALGLSPTVEAGANCSVNPSLNYTNNPGSNDTQYVPECTVSSCGGGLSIQQPAVNVTFTNKCQNTPSNGLVIGESVTTYIYIKYPEGRTSSTELGLLTDPSFVATNVQIDSIGAYLTSSTGGTISFPGNPIFINFGTVANTPDGENNQNENDTIVVRVEGYLASGTFSQSVSLDINLYFQNGQQNFSQIFEVFEPLLNISKTYDNSIIQQGRTIKFTIVVAHTTNSSADAYNVTLTDLVDSRFIVKNDTINSSIPDAVLKVQGNGLVFFLTRYNSGAAAWIISFEAVGSQSIIPGQSIADGANVTWTSTNASCSHTIDYVSVTNPIFQTVNVNVSLDMGSSCLNSTNFTIGELFTLRNTQKIPFGTLPNFTLIFALPLSPGLLIAIQGTVVSIGNAISGSSLSAGSFATISDTNSDGYSDTITYSFGEIVNVDDSDPTNDYIQLETQAQVPVVAQNTQGTPLPIAISAQYTSDLHVVQSINASFTPYIVEPKLMTTRSWNISTADAGDSAQGVIVISHASQSDTNAYVVIVTVDLGTDMEVISVDSAGNDVLSTHSFTVTYDLIQVGNNATIKFDTRFENTVPIGNSMPNITIPGANVSISQSSSCLSSTLGNTLAVGESTTFVLEVQLPEGLAENTTAVVTLPKGTKTLSVVSSSLSALPADIASTMYTEGQSGTNLNTDADSFNDLVIFYLGDVTNLPGGSNKFNLSITAQVEPASANIKGATVTPTVNITTKYQSLYSSISYTIAEPTLSVAVARSPSGNHDAGNTVNFTVTISHSSSTSPAFDLIINSTVPPSYILNSATVSINIPSATITISNNAILIYVSQLDLGQSATLTYSTVISNTTIVGGGSNIAGFPTSVSYNSSNCGTYRYYSASGSSPNIPTNEVSIAFAFTTCLSETTNTNVAIGELITFTANATLPEGILTNITVRIDVPSNSPVAIVSTGVLTYDDTITGANLHVNDTATLSNTNADAYNDRASWYLGQVVNEVGGSNQIVFELVARVESVAANINAQNLLNAKASILPNNIATAINGNNAFNFTIKEPSMNYTSTANVTTGDEGDAILFTHVISHRPSSTAPAYLLSFTVVPSANFVLVSGSPTASSGTITPNGNNFVVDIPSLILASSVTVTYVALITDNTINTAISSGASSLHYFSSSCVATTEARSYLQNATALSFSIPAANGFVVASTCTAAGASIGDTITFDGTIILPEGYLYTAVLTFQVDNLIHISSASVVALEGVTSSSLSDGSAATIQNIDADVYNDKATFNFGTLQNSPSIVGSNVTYRVVAVIPDDAGVVRGTTFTYSASFTSESQNTSMGSGNYVVKEPTLSISSSQNTTNGDSGDYIQYIFTISHTGSSNFDASNTTVNASLPSQYEVVSISSTKSGASIVQDSSSFSCYYNRITTSEKYNVTVVVRLTDDVISNTQFTGFSTYLSYSVTTCTGDIGRMYNGSVFTQNITVPNLQIAVAQTSCLSGTSSLLIAIDELVNVTSTITLPEGTTKNLTFVMSLPQTTEMDILLTELTLPSGFTTSSESLVFIDSNGDSINDTIIYYFGDVVNSRDDTNNAIFFLAQVVASDSFSNTRGSSFLVKSTIYQLNSLPLQDNITFSAAEPKLAISIVANTSSADAGDIVQYVATVAHVSPSNSPAYNIFITNLLPDLKVLSVVTSISSSIYTEQGYFNVSVGTLNTGGSFNITYLAQLQTSVVSDTYIENQNMSMTYYSSNCGLAPRSYSSNSYFANITIPNFGMSLDYSTCLSSTLNNNIAIGEIVTLSMTITFAQGTTNNVIANFTVPSSPSGKLNITSTNVYSIAVNVSSSKLNEGDSATLIDSNADGIYEIATFDLGTVINDFPANLNTIILQVDVIATSASMNVRGNAYNVNVHATHETDTVGLSSNQTLIVVEPELDITVSSNTTFGDAGDVIEYSAFIQHYPTSNSPAYYFQLLGDFIAGYLLTNNTVSVVGATSYSVTYYENKFLVAIPYMELSTSFNISFQAVLTTSVHSNTVHEGQPFTLTYQSHNCSELDFRLYSKNQTSESISILDIVANLTQLTCQDETLGNQITIGERVTFLLAIHFPEGSTDNVVVDFTLPFNLGGKLNITESVISSVADDITIALGANASAVLTDTNGDSFLDSASFSLGLVVNDYASPASVVSIEVTAIVVDTIANTHDTLLNSSVVVTHQNLIAGSTRSILNVITEPSLSFNVEKNITSGDAGDVVAFTISIFHDMSSSPAFNLNVWNPIASGYQLIPDSITVTSNASIDYIVQAPSNYFSVEISRLMVDQVATITYLALLTVDVISDTDWAGQLVYLNYTSNNCSLSDSRTYYVNDTSSTIAIPNFGMSLDYSTCLSSTLNNNIAIGEIVTLSMIITFAQGTTNNVIANFTVPSSPSGKLNITSTNVYSIAANVSSSKLNEGDSATLIDSNADGIYELATFDLGTVINDFPANLNTIILQVDVIAVDTSVNNEGTTFEVYTQVVHYDFVDGFSANQTLVLVEPNLNIIVSGNASSGDAGDQVEFTAYIYHTAPSTSAAYNLKLSSNFITGYLFTNDSFSVFGAPIFTTNNLGNGFEMIIPYLELNASLNITFIATLTMDLISNTTLSGQLFSFEYESNNCSSVVARDYTDTATSGDISIPNIAFSFSQTSCLDETSGDIVAIGEILNLTSTIDIIEGVTCNLTVVVTLPTSPGVLEIISSYISNMNGNIVSLLNSSSSGMLVDSNSDSIYDVAIFHFGDVVNPGPSDSIAVVVEALVKVLPQNAQGVNYSIASVATHCEDTAGQTQLITLTDSVEPMMDFKLSQSGAQGLPGDSFYYTVIGKYATGSTGTAYNVVISAQFPQELAIINSSFVSSLGGEITSTASELAVVIPSVPLSTVSFFIEFDVIMLFSNNETIQESNFSMTYSSSNCKFGGRNYTNSLKSVNIDIGAPTHELLISSVCSEVPANQFAARKVSILDEITFVATLTLAEGNSPNVSFNYQFDGNAVNINRANITFVGDFITFNEPTSITFLSNSGRNEGLFVYLGNITTIHDFSALNKDKVKIEFDMEILDDPANKNGESITPKIIFNGSKYEQKSMPLFISEPDLQISQQFGDITGDGVQVNVTISHTGDSTSAAHFLVATIPIGDPFEFISGSFEADADIVDSFSNGILTVELSRLNLTQSLYFTFWVAIDYSLVPEAGEQANLTIDLYYTSTGCTVGRNYSVASSEYLDVKETSSVISEETCIQNKTIDNFLVAPGEVITLSTLLNLRKGISNSTIQVQIQTSGLMLNIVNNNVTFVSPGVTTPQPVGTTVVPTDSNSDSYQDSLSFFVSATTSVWTSKYNFETTFRVENISQNIAGASANVTFFIYNDGVLDRTSTFTFTSVAPVLSIVRTSDKTIFQQGENVTVEVTVNHENTSSSDAYSLQIVNAIDQRFALISGTVQLSVESDTVYSISQYSITSNASYIFISLFQLALNETLVITFILQVQSVVVPGTNFTDSTSLYYRSVDSSNCSPGNIYNDSFTAPFSITAFNLLTLGDPTTCRGLQNISIGENFTYYFSQPIPFGTIHNLTFTVTLPIAPGVVNVTGARVTKIGSISGSLLSVGSSGLISDRNNDSLKDTVIFYFGKIVNVDNLISDDNIEFEVASVLPNATQNVAGIELITTLSTNYTGDSQHFHFSTSHTIGVEEPKLEITLSTPISSTPSGDQIPFEVVVSHALPSTIAYNVTFTISFTTGYHLEFQSINSSIFEASFSNPGNQLVARLSTLDLSSPWVVEFKATVISTTDLPPLNITLDYNSNGCSGNGFRKYLASNSSTPIDISSFDSIFVNITSCVQSSKYPNVTIGEYVTFRTYIFLSETLSPNMTTVFQLPFSGLQIISSNFSYLDENITSPLLPLGSPGVTTDSNSDGAADRVSFFFGNVQNFPPLNLNMMIVEVLAIVSDVPSNRNYYTGGTALNVTSKTTKGNGFYDQQNYTIYIVEPRLSVSVTQNMTAGESGRPVSFTIAISHNASSFSEAFNLQMNKVLSNGYKLTPGSVKVSGYTGATIDTNVPNNSFSVFFPSVPQGVTPSITYGATLTDVVISNSSLAPEQYTIAYQSSNCTAPQFNFYSRNAPRAAITPSFARNYTLQFNSTPIAIFPINTNISYTTCLADTTDPVVSIGEIIEVDQTIYLSEGTTENLVLNITTSSLGILSIVRATIVNFDVNVSSTNLPAGGSATLYDRSGDAINDTAVFNFGKVVNSAVSPANSIGVKITLHVENVADNTRGTNYFVSSKLTHAYDTAGKTRRLNFTNTVLPELSLKVSTWNQTSDAGDVIPLFLVVSHTNNSDSSAYNLFVSSQLPPELEVINGTVNSSVPSTVYLNGSNMIINVNKLSDIQKLFNVSLQLRIKNNVISNSTISPALFQLDYSSSSCLNSTGRSFRNTTNTFAIDTPEIVITQFALPCINRTNNFFSNITDLAIGDEISYFVNITFPEGTTPSPQIRVQVPNALNITNASIYYSGSSLSYSPNITVLDVNANGTPDTAVINFGSIVNAASNVLDASDTLVVMVKATVINIPGVVVGSTLVVNSTYSQNNGSFSQRLTHQFEIIEPALNISSEFSDIGVSPGDYVRFFVVVAHASNSTADAVNLAIRLPPTTSTLRFLNNSIISSPVASVTIDTFGVPTVKISELALGSNWTFSFVESTNSSTSIPTTSSIAPYVSFQTSKCGVGKTLNLNSTSPLLYIDKTNVTWKIETESTTKSTPLNMVSPGEVLQLKIRVNLRNGQANSTLYIDSPPFMTILNTQITALPNITFYGSDLSPDTPSGIVLFDFGSYSKGLSDSGIIDLIVTVQVNTNASDKEVGNISLWMNNDGKNNSANLNFPVEVVQPDLQLERTTPKENFTVGEKVQFDVVISHTNTSSTDAYSVRYIDQIDPRLSLENVTITIVNGNNTNFKKNITGNTLVVDIEQLPPGSSVIIDYVTTVTTLATPNTDFNEGATLSYSSTKVNISSTLPNLQLSLNASSNITITTGGEITINSISCRNRSDITIGETVSFYIVDSLPHGTLPKVSFNFSVPLEYVGILSSQIYGVGSSISGSISEGAAGNITDLNGDGLGDFVSYNFGSSISHPVNNISTDDSIVVEVVARVLLPSNSSLQVHAARKFGINSTEYDDYSSYNITIVEPSLSGFFDFNTTRARAGDTFTVDLHIFHNNISTVATNIGVLISMPRGFQIVSVLESNLPPTIKNLNKSMSIFLESLGTTQVFRMRAQILLTPNVISNSYSNASFAFISYSSQSCNSFAKNYSLTLNTSSIFIPSSEVRIKFEVNPVSVCPLLGYPIWPNVTVGQQIAFDATLNLDFGTTYDAEVLIYVVGGMKVVDSFIYEISSNVNADMDLGESGINSDIDGDGIDDAVTFQLGTIITSSLGKRNEEIQNGSTIIMRVIGEVLYRRDTTMLAPTCKYEDAVFQVETNADTSVVLPIVVSNLDINRKVITRNETFIFDLSIQVEDPVLPLRKIQYLHEISPRFALQQASLVAYISESVTNATLSLAVQGNSIHVNVSELQGSQILFIKYNVTLLEKKELFWTEEFFLQWQIPTCNNETIHFNTTGITNITVAQPEVNINTEGNCKDTLGNALIGYETPTTLDLDIFFPIGFADSAFVNIQVPAGLEVVSAKLLFIASSILGGKNTYFGYSGNFTTVLENSFIEFSFGDFYNPPVNDKNPTFTVQLVLSYSPNTNKQLTFGIYVEATTSIRSIMESHKVITSGAALSISKIHTGSRECKAAAGELCYIASFQISVSHAPTSSDKATQVYVEDIIDSQYQLVKESLFIYAPLSSEVKNQRKPESPADVIGVQVPLLQLGESITITYDCQVVTDRMLEICDNAEVEYLGLACSASVISQKGVSKVRFESRNCKKCKNYSNSFVALAKKTEARFSLVANPK